MTLLRKQCIKAALFIFVLAALLFGVSGDIFWANGWLYLGVFSFCSIISTIIMVRRNPDLLKERMQPGADAKSWDRLLAPIMAGLCPALIVAAAAFEVRLGSASSFPPVFVAAGVACAVAGHALMTWAMMRNDFFSALVRIQSDRGHHVTTQGALPFCAPSGLRGYADVFRGNAVHAGLKLGTCSGCNKPCLLVPCAPHLKTAPCIANSSGL